MNFTGIVSPLKRLVSQRTFNEEGDPRRNFSRAGCFLRQGHGRCREADIFSQFVDDKSVFRQALLLSVLFVPDTPKTKKIHKLGLLFTIQLKKMSNPMESGAFK